MNISTLYKSCLFALITCFNFNSVQADELNPFLQYTPDKIALSSTFHSSQKVVLIPKGNRVGYIPEFPSYTIMRLALFNGNVNFFSEQSRTEIAAEIAKKEFPKSWNDSKKNISLMRPSEYRKSLISTPYL